jgi:hypothetical protein
MQSGTIRSKNILAKSRVLLGAEDDGTLSNDEIYFFATERARDIAERYLCVESSMNLSVVANTASYDLTSSGGNQTGFFRLKLLAPPSDSLVVVSEISKEDFDLRTRFSFASANLYQEFTIWNGTLYFTPTPNATETWVVWFYKSPTTVISSSTAPETPSSFDTAIVYGTVADLALKLKKDDAAFYLEKYEQELIGANERYRGTKTLSHQIIFQDF